MLVELMLGLGNLAELSRQRFLGGEVRWLLRRKPPEMTYQRVTIDASQMGGVPCIRGLRIPVAAVVAMVADGMTRDEILGAYPDLEAGDIQEALHFAAEVVMERQLPLN